MPLPDAARAERPPLEIQPAQPATPAESVPASTDRSELQPPTDPPAPVPSPVPRADHTGDHTGTSTPAPVVRVAVVDRFVETVPRWVWWVGIAFPAALLLLGWSVRRQASLASERARMERQQRVLESRQRSLHAASEQLRQQATNDPLTGILNRRAFAEQLGTLLEHLARFARPLDLIVLDLDHFKQINDQQGHLAGDAALKLVAGIIHQHLHSDDLFGRFGGDEFLIACADRAPGETAALADAIRLAVVAAVRSSSPPMPGLSLSMGIARAGPESGYHREDLFAHADTALYAAKQGGRNRVVVGSDELPLPPASQTITRQLA